MTNKEYVISGMYSFETTCDDSPRGAQGPDISILIELTHEEAMAMGRFFKEEDPYLVEYDYGMDIVDRVRDKMIQEEDYAEEESWQFQVVWSSDLKYDCEEYYDEHIDKQAD